MQQDICMHYFCLCFLFKNSINAELHKNGTEDYTHCSEMVIKGYNINIESISIFNNVALCANVAKLGASIAKKV